jgi:hypothetical protein
MDPGMIAHEIWLVLSGLEEDLRSWDFSLDWLLSENGEITLLGIFINLM